jgi:hypothetical protein
MRIAAANLGVFVPAAWAVPEMPVLGTDWPPSMQMPPAGMVSGMAGLRDFVGARFAVPQNPILDAGLSGLREFIDASFTLPQNPVITSGMGDFAPTGSMYPIPQNSVLQYAGLAGLRAGDCGCGCGGSCSGNVGMAGLGTVMDTVNQWTTKLQSGDTVTWVATGAAAILFGWMLFGRSGASRTGYKSAKAQAREDRAIRRRAAEASYRAEIRAAREQYPTGGRRLIRAGRAARAAF